MTSPATSIVGRPSGLGKSVLCVAGPTNGGKVNEGTLMFRIVACRLLAGR